VIVERKKIQREKERVTHHRNRNRKEHIDNLKWIEQRQ